MLRNKLKSAAYKVGEIVHAIKTNNQTKKVDAALKRHYARTAGDKRVVQGIRERANDPKKYGSWGSYGAKMSERKLKDGTSTTAKSINKSTKALEKEISKYK